MRILLVCLFIISCSSIQDAVERRSGDVKPDSSVSLSKKESQNQVVKVINDSSLVPNCIDQLGRLPNPLTNQETFKFCRKLKTKPECKSALGKPIFHYNKESSRDRHIKVLVFAVTHGDEPASGSLARDWIMRLENLDPRSRWRIIPVLNPDGLASNTRTNANGVDVNRNYPTVDWYENAQSYWRKRGKSSPRRFPGNAAGSEPETKCSITHMEEFKPDFIISLHTPYGVLDFDGPKVDYPANRLLPWRRLGHMPGSLGRYMWRDKKVPVLTVELKGNSPLDITKDIEDLQDVIGTLAIRSLKSLKRY
ncbi:MAG: M14 family zinc carboxypeptidase [Bdellovibrionales bacterium]